MYKFIFTCGDVNGIGPEIALKALAEVSKSGNEQFCFICPGNVFSDLYRQLKLTFDYKIILNTTLDLTSSEKILVYKLPDVKVNYGNPTSSSGKISYKALFVAKEILAKHINTAIVTAPISKDALKKGGIKFPGHTEMLASWYNEKNFCMMFLSNIFKCGLVTIHEPIKNVAKLLNKKRLSSTISAISNSLKKDFGLSNIKIAVLGLNPHAGEKGNIGDEEIKVIAPLIKELKSLKIEGPFVPDAFFANRLYKNFDCVIGMYHDQLLIPFKLLSFERGVNFTAGLPIVRTSPDHGTAFDIAGKNIANPESMIEAYKWAKRILVKRKRHS